MTAVTLLTRRLTAYLVERERPLLAYYANSIAHLLPAAGASRLTRRAGTERRRPTLSGPGAKKQ